MPPDIEEICEGCQKVITRRARANVLGNKVLCTTCYNEQIAEARKSKEEDGASENPEPMEVRVMCPHCRAQVATTTFKGDFNHRCDMCGKTSEMVVAKMRAKRSKGDRRADMREFSLRVILLDESERLIEFVNYDYPDFELRAGDTVIISYVSGAPSGVVNLTTHMMYPVEKRKPLPQAKASGCLSVLAAIGIGVVWVFSYYTRVKF